MKQMKLWMLAAIQHQLFDIPENETVMAVISLGYRAGEPNRSERRPLDEIVKFY